MLYNFVVLLKELMLFTIENWWGRVGGGAACITFEECHE